MLRAKLALTLFIDATYEGAVKSAPWYSSEIHPDVQLVPWRMADSGVWQMCLGYSPMGPLKLPDSRNMEKDTEFFMALMNMKTELVARVAEEVAAPYVAFLDAGISKIFKDVEGSFLRLRRMKLRADLSGVVIPGCWRPEKVGVEELSRKICWMYCGGFFLVGREEAAAFDGAARAALREFLEMGRITWEVNVWARLHEYAKAPELRWFAADHNDSMTMVPQEYLVAHEFEKNPPGLDRS
jgi:hypothetical protein